MGAEPTAEPGLDVAWLRALPKAEVHVHLEGCIDLSLVTAAAARCGSPLPAGLVDGALDMPDLAALLRFLDWSCGLLSRAEDLEAVAHGAVWRAADSGVLHVDAIVNPIHFPAWSHRLDEMIEAIDRGFARAEAETTTTATLCVSLSRSQSTEEAMAVVDRLGELAHPRVSALSIDGNEAAFGRTAERFAPAFDAGRRHGLRCCAHAGESSGPEGVWDAIDVLRAERVDHGIRSIEDPVLVRELAQRRIPLDICPTSNVRLGVVASLETHPVERLRQAGVRVSLNTDDPVLFATDVLNEYVSTARAFGWNRSEVAAIARTSIESCFAPLARRTELIDALDRFLGAGGNAEA